jgi:hypothetical protein
VTAVDVRLIADLEAHDRPARQRSVRSSCPFRRLERRIRQQIEIEDQPDVLLADKRPRPREPPTRHREDTRRRPGDRRPPECLIGGVAADPEDERPVTGYVQQRQNALKRTHVTLVQRQRPVLSRDSQIRPGHGDRRRASDQ